MKRFLYKILCIFENHFFMYIFIWNLDILQDDFDKSHIDVGFPFYF